MSQSVHNDEEVPVGDDVDYKQGAGDQTSRIVPNNPGVGAQVTTTNNVGSQFAPIMPKGPNNPMYRQALIAELMQRTSPIPPINPPKEDKLAYRVA